MESHTSKHYRINAYRKTNVPFFSTTAFLSRIPSLSERRSELSGNSSSGDAAALSFWRRRSIFLQSTEE